MAPQVSEASAEWAVSIAEFSPAATTAMPSATCARNRLATPRAATSSGRTPGRWRDVARHTTSASTSAAAAQRRWATWITTWWSSCGAAVPLHRGKLVPHASCESVLATVDPISSRPNVTPANQVTSRV